MSGNSCWAGLRLRASIGGTALWLLLQSTAVWAQTEPPPAAPPAQSAPMPPPDQGYAYPPPLPVAPAPQYFYGPPPPADHRIYVRPTFEAGYEFGGDKLLEVECLDTTNNSTSTPSLRSGSGLLVGAGGHIKPYRRSPFDLHLTFDYKYQAVCNSANLERFRLTVLPTYHFGNRLRWWAGAGLIYETGIRFNGDNLQVQGTNQTLGSTSLDDAVGATVRVGWWFISLDYNFISYSKNGAHTNADDVGLVFTYDFDFF